MAAKKTTATTKSAAKKATRPAPRKTSVSSIPKTATTTSENREVRTSSRQPRIKKSYIITALAIILIAALLYAGRSLFIAAMVNGEPVTRLSVVQELEKQNGKQALNSLITKTLIYQEARKQNVSVSQQDVDSELKKINENLAAQGQKLDQVLALQGMSKDDLVDQIKIQKLIEKMVGKDLVVSDKEIEQYIADNKDSFPQGTSDAQIKSQVKQQLTQQKLNEKVQTWLDSLQKKSSITHFVNY